MNNSSAVCGPSHPETNEQEFSGSWDDPCSRVEEQLPPAMPEPLGPEATTRIFVCADQTRDRANMRSGTSSGNFIDEAPFVQRSKEQPRIESSVFGSEFAAMRTCINIIRGIQLKLRMMGAGSDTPTHIKSDGMSVIHNTSKPKETVVRKANPACHHFIRQLSQLMNAEPHT